MRHFPYKFTHAIKIGVKLCDTSRLNICKLFIPILSCFCIISIYGETIRISRLQYSGGGDWYSNPSSLKNLKLAIKRNLGGKAEVIPPVNLKGPEVWNADILFATGHGNINFSKSESDSLRRYLISGGFLWVDDNYGLDKFFRRNIRKVFPDKQLEPISSDHPIYSCFFDMKGLPKIHEHDGEPAQGFALFHEGRMILFYSYRSDIGDGLEDPDVHKLPPEQRLAAARMAVNVIYYIMNN